LANLAEKNQLEVLKGRVPPQNVEAEQCLLGAILLDNEAINRAIEVISTKDFYRESHRLIFQTMIDLQEHGGTIDVVTLQDRLNNDGVIDRVGGASYLVSLTEQVPTAANASSYARIIHEKAILRHLIDKATDIITTGYEGSGDVDVFLDNAEKAIFEIAQRKIRPSFFPIKDLVKESFKLIEELHERKELVTGAPTGFIELDRITSGLQPSDLIIVAGRPSMGKTAFALNTALNAATSDKKVPVAIFSLEMSKEQLVQRMLCGEARVDSSRLRGGFLGQMDWDNLARAAGHLSEADIFIDDTPAMNVLEIRAKSRRLQKEHGLGLIIVDYLQLMRGLNTNEGREREISEISRSLKALAKELNIPVIALSQLNRMVESRKPPKPILADLRESGAIEQDADVIMFIYREEVYDKDTLEKGVAEIIVGKQRNGPIGTVKLAFISSSTRFENLSRETPPPAEAPLPMDDLS
jgi:replicative DNA helicase